ncbi:MAG: tetratricopeptide repeat protein [bacterium]|nr:tetratricopeptide repeat protein [bacterium]
MADKRLVLLKRANKLFRQGKTDAAVKEYKQILAIKPDDLEVRRIVGDLQLRQNNSAEAIEQFDWIADYYLKEGFFAKAIAMYKRITRVDPNYEGALFKLADLYTKQGLVIEAKQIYLDLAEECKRQNNQKKALGMYKKILEFDRHNIKMRTLLADNYLKEGMENNAVDEYAITADILLNKKDFRRAEELLLNVFNKLRSPKIVEKLLTCYTAKNDDDKAIDLLSSLGEELFKNVNLLKMLGELYLKKNLMDEAENIFIKIAEIDPEEAEVIMRLGKVYLQREEYDKTFQLCLPIVEKNIRSKKFEEGASLLRFIIASNNSYLPALTKLASIFKLSGKTNNLIALYESLIPVYERKGLKDQLKAILEELIQLSDTPFTYEEQLDKLSGKAAPVEIEESKEERELEFVAFNLRVVNDALKVSDFEKAINTLIKAKTTFPENLDIRKRLFEVYRDTEKVDAAVEEGKGLLEFYKSQGMKDSYAELFDILSHLKPEDEALLEISGDEKTSIDIDFQKDELVEEIEALGASDMHAAAKMGDSAGSEEELLVLSEEQSVPAMEVPDIREETKADGLSKSLSTYLSELDFYINDHYFGEAERMIQDLKSKFPGNKELLERADRLNKARAVDTDAGKSDGDTLGSEFVDLQMDMMSEEPAKAPPATAPKEYTEPIVEMAGGVDDFIIERGSGEATGGSGAEIRLDEPEEPMELKLSTSDDAFLLSDQPEEMQLEVNLEEPVGIGFADVSDLEASSSAVDLPGEGLLEDDFLTPVPADTADTSGAEAAPAAPAPVEDELFGDAPFEIERDIAEESHSVQEHEDSKVGMKVPDIQSRDDEQVKIERNEFNEVDDMEFEIEVEEPVEEEILPDIEIDKEQLIQSPSVDPRERSGDSIDERSASGIEDLNLDLDSVMMMDEQEPARGRSESPFKEIGTTDLGYESDEDLLDGEPLFLEEAYFEIEKNAPDELEAILFWLKEVEKQRTSTIEKNMMEIFDEFKKGVDEKIGHEDYDTRYNLGIAYKEMGLLEEAIHEFLISSKHALKFFDSAGLLGMCFREKGMFSEAVTWFEKAAEVPDRKLEEYLAVKFELVMTYRLQEDFLSAKRIAEDILRTDSGYRNIVEIYEELQRNLAS